MTKSKNTQRDVAWENFHAGNSMVAEHPVFSRLLNHAAIYRDKSYAMPAEGWAYVNSNGSIYVHPQRRAAPEEWAYVLAHCLLHLGFEHFREHPDARAWNAACDCIVARFLGDLKFGRAPLELGGAIVQGRDEATLYRRFCENGVPPDVFALGTLGTVRPDMVFAPPPRYSSWQRPSDWPRLLGEGLAGGVSQAVQVAAGVLPYMGAVAEAKSAAQRAREWFIASYPLLGALVAGFTVIEDQLLCHRLSISVAAVDIQAREIFMNPAAGLSEEEYRFVMAHEILHAALRHDARRQGRDAYLWNVACDFAINAWLIEMRVGIMPALGCLHDAELKGLSAESIYDRIVTDMRRFRKLATLRGGDCDMIERGACDRNGLDATSLDEWYRRALAQGVEFHQQSGRGLLPADFIEEVRALSVPPIPWDVELAQWFDSHFPPLEKTRTYARASRRQSSTPDIARPRWVAQREVPSRTFGVLLDTSGSMDRGLLAKALGAVASYSQAREVPYARVVFCDAQAYDAGYMSPDDIAGRVQVRGRGGTILQPGVDLLENAADFPDDGPLLIITDGFCDSFRVRREHAFLLPAGHSLPFVPRGPVFRLA